MSNFTSEYFISKLAPIPKKNWNISQMSNHDGTAHCTAGWLGGYISDETTALAHLFIKHFAIEIIEPEYFDILHDNPCMIVYAVNDGDDSWGIKLKGTSPKERIMRVLYKIRRKELQDGNLRLAKQIVSNPKPDSYVTKTSDGRKSGRIPSYGGNS